MENKKHSASLQLVSRYHQHPRTQKMFNRVAAISYRLIHNFLQQFIWRPHRHLSVFKILNIPGNNGI